MASRSDVRHKSRLIREMARDLNRHDHSVASSTGSHHGTVSDSTMSDFDPENEAIMSTRQMDMDSQRLPELRDTAKKYGRWNGGRQPDFVINTSAIGRAFPDFSQGGSSDDSMSIEIGRGAKTRQRTPSQMLRPEYSNNDIDSPIVTIGDFRVLGTPPMKQTNKTSQQQDSQRSSNKKASQSQRVSSTSQKENIPPPSTASPAFLPGYISGATRTAGGEQRRTLTELHARVADESDGSFIAEERPPTVTFAQKNSRFNNFQPRNSPLSNVNNQKTRQVTETMVDALAGRRKSMQLQTPSRPSTSTMNSNTNNPTNQSFLLPSMPEISELVSGTFKDGTPVFTRNGQVQSRFASNSTGGAKDVHNPVDSIPVPGDEKAIFLSLQLLQEKVAELEMERANTQRIVEDLQNDNYQLQAEKKELQKRRRLDSALGSSGSDEEYARDNQKLIAEKTKLEGQVKSLQSRLDGTERKASNQDLRLKTNTVERDQAVKQLAEAFNLTEHLKSENAALREENQSLRQQCTQLSSENEENARRWDEMEAVLRNNINRRDQAISHMRDTTREITETRRELRTTTKSTSRAHKIRRTSSHQKLEQEQLLQTKASNSQSSTRGRKSTGQVSSAPQSLPSQRLRSRSRSQSRRISTQSVAPNDYDRGESVSDTSDEGPSEDTTKTIHKDINVTANNNGEEVDEETNFSSLLGDDLVRLRQVLAVDRQVLADRNAEQEEETANIMQLEDDTVRSTHSIRSNNTLQRKTTGQGLTGILKIRSTQNQEDVTGRSSIKLNGKEAERDRTVKSDVSHQRRYSDDSVRSARRRVTHEMTSAFILPDITIGGRSHGIEQPALSESARRKLDQLCQHDTRNCTICSRVTSFQTKEGKTTEIEIKKTVHVEKPVPVSERMPVVAPYEDEPTMRPSVTPGIALATVIKGLEDEIAHLKLELSKFSTLYNQHDPSLGMRKRKNIIAHMNKLQKEIERKCDQLYALFDVLEGQKQSGQEMSEREVEITLQNIGIDVETTNKKKPAADDEHGEEMDSDEGSDLDLPWEGIEDTISSRRQSWRL